MCPCPHSMSLSESAVSLWFFFFFFVCLLCRTLSCQEVLQCSVILAGVCRETWREPWMLVSNWVKNSAVANWRSDRNPNFICIKTINCEVVWSWIIICVIVSLAAQTYWRAGHHSPHAALCCVVWRIHAGLNSELHTPINSAWIHDRDVLLRMKRCSTLIQAVQYTSRCNTCSGPSMITFMLFLLTAWSKLLWFKSG